MRQPIDIESVVYAPILNGAVTTEFVDKYWRLELGMLSGRRPLRRSSSTNTGWSWISACSAIIGYTCDQIRERTPKP